MLLILIVALIPLVVVAALWLRYGSDEVRRAIPHARLWRRLALALMVIYAAFLTFMGVGEMIGGDISGFIHLIPAAMLAAFIFLATRRPWETGLALVLTGVLASAFYALMVHGPAQARLLAVAVGGLPWLLAGLLLLVPEWGRRRGSPAEQGRA